MVWPFKWSAQPTYRLSMSSTKCLGKRYRYVSLRMEVGDGMGV